MTRAGLLILLAAVPAAATPLPEHERDRVEVERVFGTWTDVTRTASYQLVPGGVRVRVPAAPRRAVEWVEAVPDAPMFMREVVGDFTAVVRVSCPDQLWDRAGKYSFVAGGLYAEDDAGNRAGIRRQVKRWDDQRVTLGHFARLRNDAGTFGDAVLPAGQSYLRLTRTGPLMKFACGPDGMTWMELNEYEVPWVGRLRVGVVAENTLWVPAEVTFDRYSLTQPKKGPEGPP